MRICHGLKPLVSPGERLFLAFIGRSRTNDTDNRNQPVDLADIGHPTQADHCRAFNMMHGPRPARRNHLPDRRIVERGPVGGQTRPRIIGSGQGIPHHRQATLGQDIDLDQADGFHGVHVEMGGGIPLVRRETRHQVRDWYP